MEQLLEQQLATARIELTKAFELLDSKTRECTEKDKKIQELSEQVESLNDKLESVKDDLEMARIDARDAEDRYMAAENEAAR